MDSPADAHALTAMQDYQEAGIGVLNAQLTAVAMAAGGETAKVISSYRLDLAAMPRDPSDKTL